MIKIKFLLAAVFLFFPVFVMAADSFPDFPMSFYGTATLNGVALSLGSKIQTYVGSTLQGEVILSEANVYGYDDPIKMKLVVGKFTGNLIFKYVLSGSNPESGCLIQEYTGGFVSGSSLMKNLSFISTSCGSNGSGGGGGGGGGGGAPTTYCSAVTYSPWQECIGNQQFRTILTSTPTSCTLTTSQQADVSQICPTDAIIDSATSTESIINSGQQTTVEEKVLGTKITDVTNEEKKLSTKIDTKLTKRLAGRILLQVEQKGQAWYLDAVSLKRYYLADGDSAYSALRKFGLGIKNVNINKIPVGQESRFSMTDTDKDGLPDKLEEGLGTNPMLIDTDGDGVNDGDEVLKKNTNPLGSGKLTYSSSLINRLKGRIVIQVESRGEAWYINPVDGKRYYLANGEAAYQIMRYLSLGINNKNIRTITVGSW